MQVRKGTEAELREALGAPALVFDLETTGLNKRDDKVLELSISVPGTDVGLVYSPDFLPLLKEYRGTLVGHNIVDFDQAFLIPFGVHMDPDRVHDTMLVHHLWDENKSHKLDDIVKEHYQDDYKEVFWSKYKEYSDAPEEERVIYAGKDTVYTARLYSLLADLIASGEINLDLVRHVHHLAFALAETSRRGVRVDLPYLTDLGVKLKTRLNELDPLMRSSAEIEIKAVEYELWLKELDQRSTVKGKAGVPKPVFNFNSPKQLQRLLYDQLGMPKQYKKKKLTTEFDALEAVKHLHPMVGYLQEQRELGKLYGTYVEGITQWLNGELIYPEFHVNGTVTGRISHSKPNLGNLPKTGGYRGFIVPEPGMVIISADFSQLEVCLAAHFTQDKSLLSIIYEGKSQHDITAAGMEIKRDLAKPVNFSMQYGASHFKVANLLGVSPEEGLIAYNKYWATYAGLKQGMDACGKMVDEGTPIVTLYGRKRRFEKRDRKPWDQAYRQAWNAKVQGTGADMTSISFYRVHEELKRRGWGYGLWTVHDEVLISVHTQYAVDAEKLLCETMVGIGTELGLSVPLKVESSGAMSRWED